MSKQKIEEWLEAEHGIHQNTADNRWLTGFIQGYVQEQQAKLDVELEDIITNRDYFEEIATELANDLGEYFSFEIGEWSNANNPIENAINTLYCIKNKIGDRADIQDQSGWVSVDKAKPEGPMAVDGYGFITGGYNHGDQSRWTDIFYDNEKDTWWYWGEDMERVDITGFTITHWMTPLPPTEGA